MSFKKISVLVPTRRRLNYLSQMLKSFDKTVPKDGSVELVFKCDSDDLATIEYLCKLPYRLLVGPRKEGYKSLPSFYNEMARVAEGDLLICCNDDVVFKTKDWPRLVLEEANKYPDGVFNIGVNTGLNDENYPFSIVSRRLVEMVGFLNDERLLFSDIFLLDVARHFNRAVRLKSVMMFHDWPGPAGGNDETRQDASRHEFTMVFKDAQGNWHDSYRALHDTAVSEAVQKIKAQTDLGVDLVLESMGDYEPPEAADPEKVWPPQVGCRSWNDRTPPHAIHYSRGEVRELLKVVYGLGVGGGEVLLSDFGNGLTSLFWGKVFDKVVSICRHKLQGHDAVVDANQTVLFGSLGDSRFLYKSMAHLSNLKAVVLDDTYYANICVPYFLFRKLIKPPGIVIFMNTAQRVPEHAGVHRFLSDLRAGMLDNTRHAVVDIHDDPEGRGISYELIGRE